MHRVPLAQVGGHRHLVNIYSFLIPTFINTNILTAQTLMFLPVLPRFAGNTRKARLAEDVPASLPRLFGTNVNVS